MAIEIQKIKDSKLSFESSKELLHELLSEKTSDSDIVAVLTAFSQRPMAPEELAGLLAGMKELMLRVDNPFPNTIDTCGTGGDGLKTFNISTCSALLIASGGIPVAKHGNRSMTSSSGSADVLEELGIAITPFPELASRSLRELGICFMFAPYFHPAMKRVGPIRKSLGFPTFFNIIGPLSNPAGVKNQVIGARNPGIAKLIAETLSFLDYRKVLVVTGKVGEKFIDEFSLFGSSLVHEVKGKSVQSFELSPKDLGLRQYSPDDLKRIVVEGPGESAARIESVLIGAELGVAREVVLANSALGLVASGEFSSYSMAIGKLADTIESGKAAEFLERYRGFGKQ